VTGLNVRGIDPDGIFSQPVGTANVGTAATADRNVFRSNSNANIEIGNQGHVTITNNFIGTNDAGTTAASGNGYGVRNSGYPNVAITGNVIGGSSGNAVNASGPANTVVGNKIGVSLFGAALPNGATGIEAGNFPVFIGNNTIANNGLDGINIPYGGSQVEIRGNRIFNNGRKAINLGGIAVALPNDANDVDTGPNALQNYPVISSVIKSGGNTIINWSLNSVTGTSFDLDFFSNPDNIGQPEGTAYLDPATLAFPQAVASTGAGNFASGTTTIPGLHDFITSTATNNPNGETSEFSPYVLATGALLSPTSIDFGNVVVNSTAGPQTATLTSLGAAPLQLSFVHGSNLCYGGPPAPPPICSTGGFVCSTTCAVGTPYSNGSSCGFTASFSPTGLGAQSTTIYICDNAGGNPRTLTLLGNAIAPPPPTFSPSSHSFGNVEVGTSSAVQNFVISNPSPTPVSLTPITVPVPFALLANTCGGSIPANSSCSFDARFNATSAGPASGAITATAGSGPISIPVTGNGTAPPPPTFTPPSISFGNVQVGASSAVSTFTVANPALTAVTLSSFTTSAPFSLVSTTVRSIAAPERHVHGRREVHADGARPSERRAQQPHRQWNRVRWPHGQRRFPAAPDPDSREPQLRQRRGRDLERSAELRDLQSGVRSDHALRYHGAGSVRARRQHLRGIDPRELELLVRRAVQRDQRRSRELGVHGDRELGPDQHPGHGERHGAAAPDIRAALHQFRLGAARRIEHRGHVHAHQSGAHAGHPVDVHDGLLRSAWSRRRAPPRSPRAARARPTSSSRPPRSGPQAVPSPT
jgi:hypothetical protein